MEIAANETLALRCHGQTRARRRALACRRMFDRRKQESFSLSLVTVLVRAFDRCALQMSKAMGTSNL